MVFIVSFLVGVMMADFLMEKSYFSLVLLIVFGGYVFLIFLRAGRGGFKWCLRAFLIAALGLLLGVFRFLVSFDFEEGHVSNFHGDVELKGCIESEVDVRNDKVKYTLEAFEVDGHEVFGKVLVNAARYPVYEYGQCLRVVGEMEAPEEFEGFAYDKYLARYEIYSVINRGRIELLEKRGGNWFYKHIFEFKSIFEMRLSEIFAEPHSSFMAGLILGSRKGIPDHLMEDFNTTGLTHIIAISGYNITLIIVIVSGIFSFLSRRKKVVFSVLFIVVFTILVGASAAVVRAAIMGSISLVALFFGRQYRVGLALFTAAFLMNFYNPKILVYDVGFQLSFLATCGLLYVSPLLEKYFEFLPKFLGIRESVLMTLSAQVLALPVIVYSFGRLSLICPVANLFVLPFIPLAMAFGFFAVFFSAIFDVLGLFVGFIGYLILELVVLFVKFFASIKYASVNIVWTSPLLFAGYYLFVVKKLASRRVF